MSTNMCYQRVIKEAPRRKQVCQQWSVSCSRTRRILICSAQRGVYSCPGTSIWQRQQRRRRRRYQTVISRAEEPTGAGAGAGAGAGVGAGAKVGVEVEAGATTQREGSVELQVKSDSSLGVSIYPDFAYDGRGGSATGKCYDKGGGLYDIVFDPETIEIPSLCAKTTTLFQVPIPPPLAIRIEPKELCGTVDTNTGEVQLSFDSQFCFSIGKLYSAPPLRVNTVLTTQESVGKMRSGRGSRLRVNKGNQDDKTTIISDDCRLVGVSTVPKTPTRNVCLARYYVQCILAASD